MNVERFTEFVIEFVCECAPFDLLAMFDSFVDDLANCLRLELLPNEYQYASACVIPGITRHIASWLAWRGCNKYSGLWKASFRLLVGYMVDRIMCLPKVKIKNDGLFVLMCVSERETERKRKNGKTTR